MEKKGKRIPSANLSDDFQTQKQWSPFYLRHLITSISGLYRDIVGEIPDTHGAQQRNTGSCTSQSALRIAVFKKAHTPKMMGFCWVELEELDH